MRKKLGIILVAVGLAAILSAGGLNLYNFFEEESAAKDSNRIANLIISQINGDGGLDLERTSNRPEGENDEMPLAMVDGEYYSGVLWIESLDLNIPVNRNLTYPNLKIAPCRYSGEAEDNDFVIAAHNYKSHFGRIAELTDGDEMVYYDVSGAKYVYRVVGSSSVVQPTDVDEVADSEYDLTLFTCTYGGATRVVVRAMKLNE